MKIKSQIIYLIFLCTPLTPIALGDECILRLTPTSGEAKNITCGQIDITYNGSQVKPNTTIKCTYTFHKIPDKAMVRFQIIAFASCGSLMCECIRNCKGLIVWKDPIKESSEFKILRASSNGAALLRFSPRIIKGPLIAPPTLDINCSP